MSYKKYWKGTTFYFGAAYMWYLWCVFLEPLEFNDRKMIASIEHLNILSWDKCVKVRFLMYFPIDYSLLSWIRLVWQVITVLTSGISTVNHHNFLANSAFRQTQKSPLGATSLLMLRLPGSVWGKGEGSCVLQRSMTGKPPFPHRRGGDKVQGIETFWMVHGEKIWRDKLINRLNN